MPTLNQLIRYGRKLIHKWIKSFFIHMSVLIITRLLLDWGLTWVGPLFLLFLSGIDWILSLLDWILSSMERLPISVGGGRSEAGPSNRPPIDLNRPPVPEPEHQPNTPPPGNLMLPSGDSGFSLIYDHPARLSIIDRLGRLSKYFHWPVLLLLG